MFRFLKRLLKVTLLLTAAVVIVSVYAPSIAPEIPFLPITGLIELLKCAENEALDLIPGEVKSFISKLSDAVN